MKQEEFVKTLKEKEIPFEQKDGWIIINNGGYVYLPSLKELPENIEFNNGGFVYLNSLIKLPENVEFNNGGYVYLPSLIEMPENIQFNNGGYIYAKNKKYSKAELNKNNKPKDVDNLNLKELLEKTLYLLNYPQPGLLSWNYLLRERLTELNTITKNMLV